MAASRALGTAGAHGSSGRRAEAREAREPLSRSRRPAAGPSPRGFPAPRPGTAGGGGDREGAGGPGARRWSPSAQHPPWRGESMGFAHSRCNSITALITISISRPDCLLICGKHMSGEVHIPDSAPLPTVQFRGAARGRGGLGIFITPSSLICRCKL